MAYDRYAKHKRPDEYTVGQDVICAVNQVAFSGIIKDVNHKENKEPTGYKIYLTQETATFLRDNYPSIFGQIFVSLWINETELVSLNNF